MKCPGQDTQYWKPEAIFEVKCPECHNTVEFFRDDTTRKCGQCGHRFVNPKMDFGCAAYCQYAAECLGTLPAELVAQREDLLKDRVAVEMKRFYRSDFKRIGNATRTARYAEAIGKDEAGNLALVLMAAYLHGMDNGQARGILEKLGAPTPLLEGVVAMVAAKDTAVDDMDLNANIVADAIGIAALEEAQKTDPMDPKALADVISTTVHTQGGLRVARKVLLGTV